MSGQQQRRKTEADAPAVDPYRENYTDLYGDRIGDAVWDLVDDHLSPDKIDGYAADAFGSGGSYLGELAVEHAEEGDKEHAEAFRAHLETAFREGYGSRFADTDISEGIYDFAGQNPWVLGAGAAAGLGIAYATDQDLEFDTDFDLGDHFTAKVGGDFGSMQDIGMDGASAGLEWHNDTSKLGLEGSMDFESDDWMARLYGSHAFENGGRLNGALSHTVTDGLGTTQGNLNYHQPGSFRAGLQGTHVGGPDSYTTLGANIRTDWGPENPWKLDAGVGWDSRTGTNAYAGAAYEQGDTSFGARLTHDEQNGTAGMLSFTRRF